jgi:regulatory protein
MPRQRLSLKARALQWLAQREHSRGELRRKLLRVARAEQAARLAASAAQPTEPTPGLEAVSAGCADPEQCVERLLDWLQQHRYLSEARFVESRVQARAARYGNLRIRQELAQHGLSPDEQMLRQLRDSELERARAVWQRKFGHPPADAHDRARQMRFLAQRGFSSDVVRRVLNTEDDVD